MKQYRGMRYLGISCCGLAVRRWFIAFLIFAGLFTFSTKAALSNREFAMKGEMYYSFFKEGKQTLKRRVSCQILRQGDRFKLSTVEVGSDYPIFAFVCYSNCAFTYVQYRDKGGDASHNTTNTAWNNATVDVSSYRLPAYMTGQLTPLWLMAGGNEEFRRVNRQEWINAFGDGFRLTFLEQAKTSPRIAAEAFWPDGFSEYSELFEVQDPNTGLPITRECDFRVQGWTNVTGVRFPQRFMASAKKEKTASSGMVVLSEMRFEFTADEVSELIEGSLDTRPPSLSFVTDLRPQENGGSISGFSYCSTNGVLYEDPSETRKAGIAVRPAFGEKRPVSNPKSTKATRVVAWFLLFLVALAPALIWAQRRAIFGLDSKQQ